ncbi:MAG TPA: metallophosphoesterase family protein [Bacillota bacterium]|nr:metallophosphoesterase family protein [Bacillota bacterium]
MIKIAKPDWQSRLRFTAIITLTVILTLLFIQLFARSSFSYESFSFDLKVQMNTESGTILAIPPVGTIFLQTHRSPWQITITLNEIDFTRLEKQLDSLPSKQEWLTLLQSELHRAITYLFTLVSLFGICGGALALIIFRIYPNSRRFWIGLSASVLTIMLLIGGTVYTFDQTAINRPQYRGVLASAPWAMNLISMGMDNVEVIGNNLKKVSQTLPMLYKQAGQIGSLGNMETDLTVLHVSDIHNNPAAMEFMNELVTNFKVQMVIDTGDLTDYGTALEADIVAKIKMIKIPYIFVPGNHESPLILEHLKQLGNVKLLQGQPITINGLTIAGVGDPAAANYSSDMSEAAALQALRDEFTGKIETLETIPEIIAVHNYTLAEKLPGKVPLILHGHDHQYRFSVRNDTVVIDAGTTGAAGLRGLTKDGVPYSASILYWKKDQEGQLRLSAVDSIKINGTEGKFTLDRHTFFTETDNESKSNNSIPVKAKKPSG